VNAYLVFHALGDPTRLEILERLARQPTGVGELAEGFPISRPAVSQHLRVLKEAGLVADEQAGARRIYHIEPDALNQIRAYFDRFWDQTLTAFGEVIERIVEEER
jgi:DNA-binding transcriptional ArsR family regulator